LKKFSDLNVFKDLGVGGRRGQPCLPLQEGGGCQQKGRNDFIVFFLIIILEFHID